MSNIYNQRAQYAKRITIYLLIVYAVFNLIQAYFFKEMNNLESVLFLSLVKVLPLIAFLPNIIKERNNSYIWLCFLTLPYFCWAVLHIFAPDVTKILGYIESGILVALFIAAMMFVSWKKKAA